MNTPKKQRKKKVSKHQTYSGRRQADRVRRVNRRERAVQRRQARRKFKFRVRVVRFYRNLRQQPGMLEKRAIELTLAHWAPREAWHFPLCASSIRQWHRRVKQAGWTSLYPQSKRPHTIHYQVPEVVVEIIYTLRRLYGWGGHRIAAELAARGIWNTTGKTAYRIFQRLDLPVKTYALKGRSDGIAYRRYEKNRPNAQWHIDFTQTKLTDGTVVYIYALIDDYSRYALTAVASLSTSTDWVTQVTQEIIRKCGTPAEIVSDNGREFVSVWEDTLTKFGQLLADHDIVHRTCAPYYPQGNGKVEAFNKTLKRELLEPRAFATLEELQAALDEFLTYYNNYRLHSALNWHPPATRYTGRAIAVRGLAGIPGLAPMAADAHFGPSHCDPPIPITPTTAQNSTALVLWQAPGIVA